MSFFALILKQMRQRALSTWLTLISVLLGVALATAILLIQREGEIFAQTDFGYDLIIGPKGGKLQLVLTTTYQLGQAQGSIPYAFYEEFPQNLPPQFRAIHWKLPFAVGDNYQGYRIVATTTELFGIDEQGNRLPAKARPEYRKGRSYELAEGRIFHPRKFEAVVGAEVAERTGLKIGSTYKGTHGGGSEFYKDEHSEQWTVVGILKPTHTANDRVIYIPLVSFYAVPAHEEGMEDIAKIGQKPATTAPAQDEHDDHEDHDHAPAAATQPAAGHDDHDGHDHAPATQPAATQALAAAAHDDHDHAGHAHEEAYVLTPDGQIDLRLPKDRWRISGMLVRSPGGGPRLGIEWAINNGPVAMAVNPATEMQAFFDTFLKGGAYLLLFVSALVSIVAAVSILVSIYNSVSARRKEIAILRALGATRQRILLLVCAEAGLIGAIGGLLGLLAGHALGAVASAFMERLVGQGLRWLAVDAFELLYLAIVIVVAIIAGLVPALKAYKTPVADNLVATA